MNERIRELAEQTFYYGNWEGDGIYTGQLDLEKFAKSIVEECAGIYCSIDNGNLHMGTDDYLNALHKHFGEKKEKTK